MKKILAILFAVVVSISAISVGIIPAAAATADWDYEVFDDYERYITPSNYDGAVDVSGQYFFDITSFFPPASMAVGSSFELIRAPAGFYILFRYGTFGYKICDLITVTRYSNNTYLTFYLDDVEVSIDVVNRGYDFILPCVPILSDDSSSEFWRYNYDLGRISIVKYGYGSPIPAYVVPDQSLPRILEVWQSVTGWIVDGLSPVAGVFYAAGQLTLIGTLAVISVGIALIFLLIAFIRKFLFLRG